MSAVSAEPSETGGKGEERAGSGEGHRRGVPHFGERLLPSQESALPVSCVSLSIKHIGSTA